MQVRVDLIGTVDGDIKRWVLFNVSQDQFCVDDQLFGLEAFDSLSTLKDLIERSHTGRDKHSLLVDLWTLSENAFYDIRYCRAGADADNLRQT